VTNYGNTKINNIYGNIQSPEEHYFLTLVYLNNLQNKVIITHNLSNDATTFTNWEGMDYKYVSTKDLKDYMSITEEEIIYLLNSKCLFGRKFNSECYSSLNNKIYIDFITSK
jgi:hypothetical protein